MDNFVDFLADNALVIIIVAVVLIMALVGFIAEKSGFSTKDRKPKKNKKETVQEQPAINFEQIPAVPTEFSEPVITTETPVMEEAIVETPVSEEVAAIESVPTAEEAPVAEAVPMAEEFQLEPTLDQTAVFTPIEATPIVTEDLNAPMPEFAAPVVETPDFALPDENTNEVEEVEPVAENIEPAVMPEAITTIEATPEVIPEAPESVSEDIVPAEVEIPNLEPVQTEVTTEETASEPAPEDVWKF